MSPNRVSAANIATSAKFQLFSLFFLFAICDASLHYTFLPEGFYYFIYAENERQVHNALEHSHSS